MTEEQDAAEMVAKYTSAGVPAEAIAIGAVVFGLNAAALAIGLDRAVALARALAADLSRPAASTN